MVYEDDLELLILFPPLSPGLELQVCDVTAVNVVLEMKFRVHYILGIYLRSYIPVLRIAYELAMSDEAMPPLCFLRCSAHC